MFEGFDLYGGADTGGFDAGSSFDIPSGGFDLYGAGGGGFEIPSGGFDLGAAAGGGGFQDWLNSLGTGVGTYGTGLDWENQPISLGQPQQQQQPAAGGTSWMDIGRAGLGTLGSVAGLGLSGLGMANAVRGMQQGKQQQKVMQQAQQAMQQTAAPAAQAGANLTRAGEQAMLGGPLPAQMESMVDKWKAETRGRIQSYLAKSGISDSTMAAQFESWIAQNEGLYRQQLAQSLLQSGYGGVATAMGPAQGMAQSSANQMGGTDQFLKEANNSIALLTGSQR